MSAVLCSAQVRDGGHNAIRTVRVLGHIGSSKSLDRHPTVTWQTLHARSRITALPRILLGKSFVIWAYTKGLVAFHSVVGEIVRYILVWCLGHTQQITWTHNNTMYCLHGIGQQGINCR